MKFLTLILALFCALTTQAKFTIRIIQVPGNTPTGSTLSVAGTFNSWTPGLAAYQFSPSGAAYLVTLPASVRGRVEFKITRGSWAMVETNATGGSISNRVYTIPATGTDTLNVTVEGWEDLLAGPRNTASPSVSVLAQSMPIPQLPGRSRRIWLYLPPDYATSTKTYPVLYMHDGQNLFDNATSYSGEWGVDETLDQLQTQGDWGCIVVGIENGGAYRFNEYSPYVNPQYGGGDGDEYIDFIANTLKPFVDQHYRTRPDRQNTGIMGSSMGGLISLYGALKRPEVFGRSGVFSASLWFNRSIYTYARTHGPQRPGSKMYMMSGGRESQSQAGDQRRMADTLALAGWQIGTELDTAIRADGQHNEAFWKREFATAYRYLFGGIGSNNAVKTDAGFEVYPNPGPDSNGMVTVRTTDKKPTMVEIIDSQGRVVKSANAQNGTAKLDARKLPAGSYQIRINGQAKAWVKK